MMSKLRVVGDPIEHSISPQIHAQFAQQFDHDVIYDKERVDLESFAEQAEAFRASGGLGMNVTVPLKGAAFAYVDVLDPVARSAGAVNTIHFCDDEALGYNTDGWGLVRDLTYRWQVELQDQAVLLLGAGGASRGVVVPLFESGVRQIIVANRTLATAQRLCEELAPHTNGRALHACGLDADLSRYDVDTVVNATSIGLSAAVLALPLSDEQLRETFCYDMGYGENAGFLRQIQGRARTAVDGLGMLVEQAARSYEIWLGVAPNTDPVFDALRGQF